MQGLQTNLEGLFRYCFIKGLRAIHLLHLTCLLAARCEPAPGHWLEQVRRPHDGQLERADRAAKP